MHKCIKYVLILQFVGNLKTNKSFIVVVELLRLLLMQPIFKSFNSIGNTELTDTLFISCNCNELYKEFKSINKEFKEFNIPPALADPSCPETINNCIKLGLLIAKDKLGNVIYI